MMVLVKRKDRALSSDFDDVVDFEVTDIYVRFVYISSTRKRIECYFMLSELEYFKTISYEN